MAKKIVLVTAGGHIAPFHAAMKNMHDTLNKIKPGKFELWGADDGLEGLIDGRFIPINYEHIEECRAGSLIGADRKVADSGKVAEVINSHKDVYAVIMMGGDNHLGEASKLWKEAGIRIVGYPKTMDGDLSSFITLGWETAVTIGAMQTRLHHNSAITNRRVFYIGLFGRNTDWTVTGVSAYGGGDLAIPCEQKYDFDYVWENIEGALKHNKEKYGKEFAVVPYSEGARIKGVKEPPKEHRSKDAHGLPKLLPEWLGMELVRLTKEKGKSSAFQAHTYDMRDSPPTETDMRLSAMAGEECIKMIVEGDFGKGVIFYEDGNGFYTTGRDELENLSKQKRVKSSGFFDYKNLIPTALFGRTYADLFRNSLGEIPKKDNFVYKNMRKSKKQCATTP